MHQAARRRSQLPGRTSVSEAARHLLLRRLARQFASAVADGSEVVEAGAFRVHLWPNADPFYRNVAVPIEPTSDWQTAIAAMVRAFETAGRTPRLEFFAELWPDLPSALEAAGFVPERRGEVMAMEAFELRPAPSPVQPRLLDGNAPRSLLAAFLARAGEAFGESAAIQAPGELERFAYGLRRGTIRAAAVLETTVPISGASLTGLADVAELVGVWTRAGWRRRGYARASCTLLLQRLFAAGGSCAWLSAGDAASAHLYRSLGFRACGLQLNYVRPPPRA